VTARLVEIALVTIAMEQWIDAIDPAAPFQDTSPRLDTGDAMGSDRGGAGQLGHWLRLEEGGSPITRSSPPPPGISRRVMPERPGRWNRLWSAPLRPDETEPVASMCAQFRPLHGLHGALMGTCAPVAEGRASVRGRGAGVGSALSSGIWRAAGTGGQVANDGEGVWIAFGARAALDALRRVWRGGAAAGP
jgi:hypothetical protein